MKITTLLFSILIIGLVLDSQCSGVSRMSKRRRRGNEKCKELREELAEKLDDINTLGQMARRNEGNKEMWEEINSTLTVVIRRKDEIEQALKQNGCN